jgi:hypothetical protein
MNDIQNIGLGGALLTALLILKEVVTRLLPVRKNGDGTAGSKSPDYWERRYDKIDNTLEALRGDIKHFKELLEKDLIEVNESLVTLIRLRGGS